MTVIREFEAPNEVHKFDCAFLAFFQCADLSPNQVKQSIDAVGYAQLSRLHLPGLHRRTGVCGGSGTMTAAIGLLFISFLNLLRFRIFSLLCLPKTNASDHGLLLFIFQDKGQRGCPGNCVEAGDAFPIRSPHDEVDLDGRFLRLRNLKPTRPPGDQFIGPDSDSQQIVSGRPFGVGDRAEETEYRAEHKCFHIPNKKRLHM